MCVIFFAHRIHPDHPLILIANRDEFYDRPTAPASRWTDKPSILAGRDLVHGGTWLGVTDEGRFAAVTNYRQPSAPKGNLSRGALVSGFLDSTEGPEEYLRELSRRSDGFSGFNLLVGDRNEAGYFSNREGVVRILEPGIYGLSNHLLDTPWPKVRRGKARFASAISGAEIITDNLFSILGDKSLAPDEELPDTGVGYEREKLLSAIFIETPIYGTRSSTVVIADRDFNLSLDERTFV